MTEQSNATRHDGQASPLEPTVTPEVSDQAGTQPSGIHDDGPGRAPRWGVAWIAAFLIFNALLDGPLSDTFGEAWRILAEVLTTGFAFAAFVSYVLSPAARAVMAGLMKPLLAVFAYAAIQAVILSVHPAVSFYAIRNISRLPLVIMGVAWFAREASDRKRLTMVLIGVGCIESLLLIGGFLTPDLSVWQALRPSNDAEVGGAVVALAYDSPYPSGTFTRYNHAAEFVLPIALLSLGLALSRDRTRGAIVAGALCSAGLVVTGSRTAQLTLVLSLLPLLAGRRIRAIGILGGGGVLLASFVYGQAVDYAATTEEAGSVMERYLSLFSASYWETLQEGELERWPAAINGTESVLERHPLLGTGLGTVGSTLTNSSFQENDGAAFAEYNRLPWLEQRISLRAIADVGWACLLAQAGLIGVALIVGVYLRLLRAARPRGQGASVWSRVSTFVWFGFCIFNATSSAFLSRSFLSSAAVVLGLAIAEARARGVPNEQGRPPETGVRHADSSPVPASSDTLGGAASVPEEQR